MRTLEQMESRKAFINGFNASIPELDKARAAKIADGLYDGDLLRQAKLHVQTAFALVMKMRRDDEMTEELLFSLAALVHDTCMDKMIEEEG